MLTTKTVAVTFYIYIMSHKIEIKTLILEYILKQSSRGHHPISQEIERYLIHTGNTVSLRTVQRRLRELQDDDWIDKDKQEGYFLDEEHNAQKMNNRVKLEHSLAYESIWSEHSHYHLEGYPIISFEAYNNFQGAENLRELVFAIQHNRLITFHYTNIYKPGADSDRRVLPLFLKEYLNRWYLMAWDMNIDQERLFGIDRISALSLLPEQVDAKPYYDITWSRFDSIVGLRYSEGPEMFEPMDLIIRCMDIHIHFLDSLPVHPSQEKIPAAGGTKDQTRYRYRVAANFELEQRLLSMSHLIEILEPAWYRDAFKKKLHQLWKQYQ